MQVGVANTASWRGRDAVNALERWGEENGGGRAAVLRGECVSQITEAASANNYKDAKFIGWIGTRDTSDWNVSQIVRASLGDTTALLKGREDAQAG